MINSNIMTIRYQQSPVEFRQMNAQAIRSAFLIDNLFEPGKLSCTYSHYDRMIIGGVVPLKDKIVLGNKGELKADYFLQRREIGIINIGGEGVICADEARFSVRKFDCVYIGRGTKEVEFQSTNPDNPAYFYFLSAPAHMRHDSAMMQQSKANPTKMGAMATANDRTIYKYIHADGLNSCQLVMGLTVLNSGSVWNTMPPHTHSRRMEAYLYFDLDPEQRVFHLMGEPEETRHVIVANRQAVVSPPWSIHCGCGTGNYAFIWGMAGENLAYNDMDPAPLSQLR